jgi:hypothetical protein
MPVRVTQILYRLAKNFEDLDIDLLSPCACASFAPVLSDEVFRRCFPDPLGNCYGLRA